ncbi:MAG: UDP-3-O-(3-hydroxymyristoyl)glucosamine N-acyltransferase, partial [Betaproteobacteria bacterium]|nr:UDP-3-O-(3-hydroxymyristoyl)glucosamine N-acyltransferase [Betaproteobacteria bacterium]
MSAGGAPVAGPFTLAQIVERLGGRVVGDAATQIRQVGSLGNASAGQLAFLSGLKHKAELAATRASAVILSEEHQNLTGLPRIVCKNPYAYFAKVSQLFNALTVQPEGIDRKAFVSATAKIGARVSIGPGCVVGDEVTIGEGSCLYPNVTIYPRSVVGARCVLHAGAVIGADGFGIAEEDGRWV